VLILAVAGISPSSAEEAPAYVEGEVLVRFRAGMTLEKSRRRAESHGSSVARHYEALSRRGGRPLLHLRAKGKTTAQLLEELRHDPAVETVEPNYVRQLLGTNVIPNDVMFPYQWAMRNTGQTVNGTSGTPGADVRGPEAWAFLPFDRTNVIVGVIDTGVDGWHPDMTSNLWINTAENPTNGVDDDSNGYIDDYYGYNFAGPASDPCDSGSHGSHVAGIVAATGQNRIGIIGAAWPARLMSLRASSNGTSVAAAAELEAIQYATMMRERGVNIVAINASYGGGTYSTFEHDAIRDAADAGIVFCAATWYSAVDHDVTPIYPACYNISNIIAVAASDRYDQLYSASGYGATTVDLAAPGVAILSPIPVVSGSNTITVTAGGSNYTGQAFRYGGFTTGLTATLYNCATGCCPSDFPPGVVGNIALIERGTPTFNVQVANAMAAGAVAVILYNNQTGSLGVVSLRYPTNWIPVVGLSQSNGQTLVGLGNVTATVTNTVAASSIYDYRNGTSSAAPHVAGAVALAALCFPEDGVTTRIQRILSGVTPTAGLAGKVRTGGRLNLARLIDANTNGLPDWWEIRYFGALTNSPSGDKDSDLMSNWAEWQAGTDPTNAASCLTVDLFADGLGVPILQWPSVTGHTYSIEVSTNLPAGFILAATNISATPPSNAVPVATNSPEFYRVKVE
jgi:subtilisin family serine protease